jgi:hypothetical protein
MRTRSTSGHGGRIAYGKLPSLILNSTTFPLIQGIIRQRSIGLARILFQAHDPVQHHVISRSSPSEYVSSLIQTRDWRIFVIQREIRDAQALQTHTLLPDQLRARHRRRVGVCLVRFRRVLHEGPLHVFLALAHRVCVRALRDGPEADFDKGAPHGLQTVRIDVCLVFQQCRERIVALEEPVVDARLVDAHGTLSACSATHWMNALGLCTLSDIVLEAVEELRQFACCGISLV